MEPFVCFYISIGKPETIPSTNGRQQRYNIIMQKFLTSYKNPKAEFSPVYKYFVKRI
jgi:hypothetical protein